MPIVRVRQHVNPLSHKYQVATQAPQWGEIFHNPNLPLHVDIGSARGQFLLEMAQAQPDWNFVGVEIREPLVDRANEESKELGLTNLHFLFCNINTSLTSLFQTRRIQGTTIQFPDPWFKRRHQKRRVVQPEFLTQLSACLASHAFLFIQSDVLEIATEMRDRISDNPAFRRSQESHQWLSENPLGVSTERERTTLAQGKPVYRCWFEHHPVSES
jgi:tRNA (guanine-N7-)-methyltransferase